MWKEQFPIQRAERRLGSAIILLLLGRELELGWRYLLWKPKDDLLDREAGAEGRDISYPVQSISAANQG